MPTPVPLSRRTATANDMPTRNAMNRTIIAKKTALRSLCCASDSAEDLRASQRDHVAAAEVAWFFTSYDNTPAACLARSTIEGWLSDLEPGERRTLSLRFDVSPWAEDLQVEGLRSGLALAVDLVSSAGWHAKSSPRDRNHRRACERLEASVRERGIEGMGNVGRRADWAFESAVRAYARARGRAPSVLPRLAA